MRAMVLGLVALLAAGPAAAVEVTSGNNVIVSRGSTATGPRILGEPAFAFELDALEQAEVSRPGWPVTTTRASTRMCWTGSAWQTVPANTPCIGVWGLASFGAGTNYWADSTSFAGWSNTGAAGNTAEDKGSYWAFLATANGAFRDPGPRGLDVTAGQTIIATCELRSSTGATVRVEPGPNFIAGSTSPVHTLTPEWRRYSSAAVAALAAGTTKPYLYDITTGEQFDARQCQLELGVTTPGPRHDCGASACSWQGDVHTVSTAGWPVEAGRIDLQYTAHTPTITTDAYLLYGGVGGVRMRRNAAGSLAVFRSGVAQSGGMVDWSETRTISLRWDGVVAAVYIDGAHYMDIAGSVVTGAWDAVAYLGNSSSGSLPAQGHIRLVRISE